MTRSHCAASWDKWAVRPRSGPEQRPVKIGARGIFHDLGVVSESGETKSFAYDMPYFDWSHPIHSTAQSLVGLVRENQQYFCADSVEPSQVRLAEAVNAANIFLVQALGELDSYAGINLDPELGELWAKVRRDVPKEPADDIGPLTTPGARTSREQPENLGEENLLSSQATRFAQSVRVHDCGGMPPEQTV